MEFLESSGIGWRRRIEFAACQELHREKSYLLGLLAMMKCSICSYQCDNCYVSNWRLACHVIFFSGYVFLSLLRSFHVLSFSSLARISVCVARAGS